MPTLRIVATLLFLYGGSASAQGLAVRVTTATGPLGGALVRVLDLSGKPQVQRFSDERGQVRFDLRSGTYTVRVDGIGYASRVFERVVVGHGAAATLDVELESKPLVIDEISVRGERSECRSDPRAGSAAAELWNEARKNLEFLIIGRHHRTAPLRITRFSRRLSPRGVVMQEETSETHGDFIQPFTAASAATLLQDGFVQQEGDESVYYAPDAALLLSEAFAMAYCFRAVLPRQRRSEPPSPLIGIAFEPARVVKPAIEGTIWLDRTTGYVSSLEFRYRGIPVPNEAEGQAGGRLSFSRASHGVIIIDEWSIRMPIIGITLASSGRQQEAVRAFMEVGASISALEIHRYRHRTVVRLDHRRTAGWGIDRNRRRDSARPFRLERAVRPAHRTVWQLRFADSPPPYRRARHHAARARGHGADA